MAIARFNPARLALFLIAVLAMLAAPIQPAPQDLPARGDLPPGIQEGATVRILGPHSGAGSLAEQPLLILEVRGAWTRVVGAAPIVPPGKPERATPSPAPGSAPEERPAIRNHEVTDLVPPRPSGGRRGLRLIDESPRPAEPRPWQITPEGLVRLIKSNVATDSWDDPDATSIVVGEGFALVIHSASVQRSITRFLDHLRTLNSWDVPGWSETGLREVVWIDFSKVTGYAILD